MVEFAVAPRMSPPLSYEAPLVWRVREPDLNEIQWVPERLAEDHPRLQHDGIFSWMRAAMNDRTTLLIRTKNVVGLFQAEFNVLDPFRPMVCERWVRSREKSNEEAPLLYKHARDWAHSIKASRFIYNLDTDCAMSHVNPHLSDVRKEFIVRKDSIFTVRMDESA